MVQKRKFTICIPTELDYQITKMLNKTGNSRASFIRSAIVEKIKNEFQK